MRSIRAKYNPDEAKKKYRKYTGAKKYDRDKNGKMIVKVYKK